MKVGIAGAGTMGQGIAQTFAQAKNFEVLLCSSDIETAVQARNRIAGRLEKHIMKKKIDEKDAGLALSKIAVGHKRDCCDCDLLIESTTEDIKKKRNLFMEMQEICRDNCIFATNTSSLSVTEMSMGIRQPVIGMHFFNPAPVMQLVEVVCGLYTPAKVVDKITEIAVALGKTPVRVQESPGFIVNRILIPMINEAVGLLAEGTATAEDIDTAMKLGTNQPMGPLELGDFIGLDICLAIMETMQAETGDPKYRPHPLLRKMVRGGQLGVKTHKGFYMY